MSSALAAEDFTYKIHFYDSEELDESKEHEFKKGDPLPRELVQRLERQGPDYWIKYVDGKSKKSDIPEKPVSSVKHTFASAKALSSSQQRGLLKKLDAKEIPRLEDDRVKLILELQEKS